MMGWKYEYGSDLENEERIIERVKEIWNCGAFKMEGFSYADYILTRGMKDGIAQGVAFCELRCRSTPMGAYPTIFITLNKIKNMVEMGEFCGVPSFFVVQWSDQCAYVELTKDHLGLVFPERRKPKGADHYDEPCILLPVDQFKTLWDGGA